MDFFPTPGTPMPPPLWAQPLSALEDGDRRGFDEAMAEAQRVYSSVAFDVISVECHRRALDRRRFINDC